MCPAMPFCSSAAQRCCRRPCATAGAPGSAALWSNMRKSNAQAAAEAPRKSYSRGGPICLPTPSCLPLGLRFEIMQYRSSTRHLPCWYTEEVGRCSGGGVAVVSEELCLLFLSNCRKIGAFGGGICVHSPVIKLGIADNLFLNNNLLSVYCKGARGYPATARKLFEELRLRDVVSWTTIISAHVRAGCEEEALDLFDLMFMSGFIPNDFTLSCVLRSCAALRRIFPGVRTHAQIVKYGHESNTILLSALVDFYAKNRIFEEAFRVFILTDEGDTVLWTIMISGLVEGQERAQAVQLYARMMRHGVKPNEFTFVKLLSACDFLGLHFGKLFHAQLLLWDAHLNVVLKTALVDMYSKCGRVEDALKIFNETPEFDAALWTALISGYIQAMNFEEAVQKFQDMMAAGIMPVSFTYSSVLSACSSLSSPKLGQEIHSQVIKAGLRHDISVGNALMDMYTKCFSSLTEPVFVFEEIVTPNVVTWTVLISTLMQHQLNEEALSTLGKMMMDGVLPNSFTLTTLLKGCETSDTMVHVEKIHAYVLKNVPKYILDLSIWNSLLDAYARLGKIHDAWMIFDTMTDRDAITYTSLAKGFNKMGFHQKTIGLVTSMHGEGLKMDCFCLSSFLSASAGLTALEPGRQLHCHSIKSGLNAQVSVLNGLVDMYGKCGDVREAYVIFQENREPNNVSWNCLISTFASNGMFSDVLSSFENMRLAGLEPDGITFLLVLHACSHAGLIDMGLDYFNSMTELHGIVPQVDHYVCLVDLLGRAGRLEKAASVIEEMPFEPDALIYKTLLSSCRLGRNLALGEWIAGKALTLDPHDPAIYVLLSGMYDDAGKLEHSKEIRRMMKERGVRKFPGQSWI